MKPPSKLYRYRPLDDALLKRELCPLRDSYLFSPPFTAMNDPMEAFHETGGPGDRIIDAMLAPSGKGARDMYAIVTETIGRFGLVSFASTYDDLPIWAYYGSNFAGMCLEFNTVDLDRRFPEREPATGNLRPQRIAAANDGRYRTTRAP